MRSQKAIDVDSENEAIEQLRTLFVTVQQQLQQGHANDALPPLRDILQLSPGNADALNLISVAFGQLNMPMDAERYSRQAISKRPENAGFHLNLANRLNDQERYEDAILSYQKAIELAPELLAALKSYLRCLVKIERWQKAAEIADQLIPLVQDNGEQLVECANACLGANRLQRGLELYQQALTMEPDKVPWLLQLARIAVNLDQIELAKSTGDHILTLEEEPEIRAMLASIMHRHGDLDAMAVHLEHIPDDGPQKANANNLIGMMSLSQAKVVEGLDAMALNETLVPDIFPLQATRIMYLNYHPDISRKALRDAHDFVGRQFDHALPLLDQADLGKPHDPERKLRIGVMSPDLRAHSVAYFARPYLSAFDQDSFDVHVYASVAKEDEVSIDLSRLPTSWKNVFHLNDQQLAETIREDRIDILIDLAGLTRDTRLLTMTARPAPVQMTYIGYPNTTGLSAVDYRITDWISDPEGTDDDYCETLIRMPDCFLSYAIPLHAPPVGPCPFDKNGYVTFGSFNNFAKANTDVLALWADVLNAVPGSRLLCKSTSSHDPTAQQTIRDVFERQGVDSARIDFSLFRDSARTHLEVYNDVDIALDTFPYNGTTTTCEALWMGVPVITLKGNRHASRVGTSLLNAIGFPAGVADTPDDYVMTARLLAETPGLLRKARSSLRETLARSTLCDHQRHARQLELAFREVWRIWCEDNIT